MNKDFFDRTLDEIDIDFVQEGTVSDGMDFDFDEDVEDEESNTASIEDKSSGTEPLDYEKKYIEELSKKNSRDDMEELEVITNSKMPKDFAEGITIFDNNNFSNTHIKQDGKLVFVVNEMWPLNRIIIARKQENQHIDDDKLFAIGDDGFGNFIVMKTDDWTYHIWYHDTKNTVMIAKAFNEEGADPGYNISAEDTLLFKLGYKLPDDPAVTEEPGVEEVPEAIEDTDEVAIEEEPDGSAEVTEDIEVAEEPAIEEEPTEETPAETEEPPTEDEPTLESFVQEDGEEESRVDETLEEDAKVEEETPNASDDDRHFLSYEELGEISDKSDSLDGSTTPEGDDLKDFGTDTSDVQNEYDPKEIEILNKLIAAEGEAINDYFDASKDSHDSDARRLYSDIGHEERFHLEQLLFMKSQITGEKYEPRDPEVRKEYEELRQMGMDDHTAAATAIDKTSMEDNGGEIDEFEIEILEQSVNNSLELLRQNEILLEATNYLYEKRAYNNIIEPYGVILEQYIQEEVINTGAIPEKERKGDGPIKLLINALKKILDVLRKTINDIKAKMEQNRIHHKKRKEWIEKNGVAGLFANGIHLYFYNDADSAVNMVIPVQYVDLLYRLSVDIGKKCGVTITPKGYHGTIKKPIKYGSIAEGIEKIKHLDMTKTKVVVNDNNKDALVNEFFGYSDMKVNAKMWNEEANRAIYESNNAYTKLELFCLITNQYSDITNDILKVMDGLQGDMNSIYYKDRKSYNTYRGYMKIIVSTYSKLIAAATSDLNEMLKLDKEVINVTRSRDAGNPLPEGEPDRRTSGSNGDNRKKTPYAKTKK